MYSLGDKKIFLSFTRLSLYLLCNKVKSNRKYDFTVKFKIMCTLPPRLHLYYVYAVPRRQYKSFLELCKRWFFATMDVLRMEAGSTRITDTALA